MVPDRKQTKNKNKSPSPANLRSQHIFVYLKSLVPTFEHAADSVCFEHEIFKHHTEAARKRNLGRVKSKVLKKSWEEQVTAILSSQLHTVNLDTYRKLYERMCDMGSDWDEQTPPMGRSVVSARRCLGNPFWVSTPVLWGWPYPACNGNPSLLSFKGSLPEEAPQMKLLSFASSWVLYKCSHAASIFTF